MEPRITRKQNEFTRKRFAFIRAVFARFAAPSILTGALLLQPISLHAQKGFGPGERTLLDAHNSYPQNGRWIDRIDRALSTGVPVAIEQDLFWKQNKATGQFEIVVAHDKKELDAAPTLEAYFFEKIRPVMERALKEDKRNTWPLIVLNLDFKQNDAPLLDAVFTLLGKYESWLTTAPRTATPNVVAPFTVGPLLVLSGSNPAQRVRFHDAVPIGQKLRAFGAIPSAEAPGADDDEREANMSRMAPDQLIVPKASNYARWVNFPWLVVEPGGPTKAGDWNSTDATRLKALVQRAHDQQLWIRFYTLDGFLNGDGDGLTRSYNFGGDAAVKLRWKAAIESGVDFIATDHYERFHESRSRE